VKKLDKLKRLLNDDVEYLQEPKFITNFHKNVIFAPYFSTRKHSLLFQIHSIVTTGKMICYSKHGVDSIEVELQRKP
jgi:hypothetical protein